MIITQLRHAPRIYAAHPRLQPACEFLMRENLHELHAAKAPANTPHEVDGKNIIALFQEYETVTPENAAWETHNYHIDLQCLLAGEEAVGYAKRDGATLMQPYNAERDCNILQPVKGDYVRIKEDLIIILFPEDAHQPRVLAGKAMTVKKVCLKILI